MEYTCLEQGKGKLMEDTPTQPRTDPIIYHPPCTLPPLTPLPTGTHADIQDTYLCLFTIHIHTHMRTCAHAGRDAHAYMSAHVHTHACTYRDREREEREGGRECEFDGRVRIVVSLMASKSTMFKPDMTAHRLHFNNTLYCWCQQVESAVGDLRKPLG